jgi:hypothetical protein
MSGRVEKCRVRDGEPLRGLLGRAKVCIDLVVATMGGGAWKLSFVVVDGSESLLMGEGLRRGSGREID